MAFTPQLACRPAGADPWSPTSLPYVGCILSHECFAWHEPAGPRLGCWYRLAAEREASPSISLWSAAEAAREVAAAHTRVAECERLLHSTREAAEGKAPAEAARWREVSLAARRQSEAERASEAATAAKQEAEQAVAATQLNMIRLKVLILFCWDIWSAGLMWVPVICSLLFHERLYFCCQRHSYGTLPSARITSQEAHGMRLPSLSLLCCCR